MTQFKPILAGKVSNIERLSYPLLASPKLDGVRAVGKDNSVLSRSLKPIRNLYTQEIFKDVNIEGIDGELIVGSPTAVDVFRLTNSGVMSIDGTPDVAWYVFDDFSDPTLPFTQRYEKLKERVAGVAHVVLVEQIVIHNATELRELEEHYLALGYEGVMIRSLDGTYKFGRSTAKEGTLLKLKRFLDSEAVIIGFIEEMGNTNTAKTDELGHTKRGHSKSGMVPKNTLGALKVRDIKSGLEFEMGSGLDEALSKEIWENRETYLGKIAKYKYFPYGVKELPRFPVFLGFRDEDDM